MTTRRSVDLDVPAEPRPVEESLPANVLEFRVAWHISREEVAAMSRRQDQRAREKAIARHARRRGRRQHD